MDIYSFILGNKETFKIIYAAIIVFTCLLIVLKTNKLFQLSSHSGIRYFRNAFLFYGIAFFVRYFLVFTDIFGSIITPLFEFFIIMGGFFLTYSLLSKRLNLKFYYSSLLNPIISIFYLFAIILVLFDIILKTSNFMFLSQIVLFVVSSSISYINYKEAGSKNKFLKFYFSAMILILLAWILNFFVFLLFGGERSILINVYILNLVFFLIFLYGVIKITKN
ncbi:MAG: hypothetical protein AABW63_01050 [Nanoarchaeota archaeon]